MNIGTGKYDLQRLIFHDIVDNEIRYELLQHFAVQAASCQHSCHAPQVSTATLHPPTTPATDHAHKTPIGEHHSDHHRL